MVILMAGVIFTEPYVCVDADANAYADAELREVLGEKLLSGSSPCLEDILHPSEVPDGDHYAWFYLH